MARGTFQVTLTVEPAPEPLAVASPEDLGQVGAPFLNPALMITGGTPPYTVSVTGGALPDGVAIDANGNFSGTKNAAGSFDVTVEVADSQG